MKKYLLSLLFCSVFFLPFFSVEAAGVGDIGKTLNQAATNAGFSEISNTQEEANLAQRVGLIVEFLLGVVGVLAVLYAIYGGVMWTTAGGNDGKVQEAQKVIRNAVLGIMVVGMAYLIVAAAIQLAAGISS